MRSSPHMKRESLASLDLTIRISSMQNRQQHQQEALAFLNKNISGESWEFSLPHGWGNETYYARGGTQACFVKLGVQPARYQVMGSIGLTPPVLATGVLADGTTIIVQLLIDGRKPSRKDYREQLEQFAMAIKTFHHNLELQRTLPPTTSGAFSGMGLETVNLLKQKWALYRAQVPEVSSFIDDSLEKLGETSRRFHGQGLVASHNDICNMNWLLSAEGRLYLLDLESMSLDDPALDVGATLWWYYPPELRGQFLEQAGYAGDPEFEQRMQIRMALHCLNILLPREDSFDEFEAASFADDLTDFKAALAGEENPQGYDD
jgi:thiamine kinase-like enzyme